MDSFRQFAIIGPTASGKTALSVRLAHRFNAHILSLDSLSIYKEIDIVSAKPTLHEREGIVHYGIDHLYPDESFDVTTFITLYKTVYTACVDEGKNLIIVGGTSFYLKILLEGISERPRLTEVQRKEVIERMQDTDALYRHLASLDPEYMHTIKPGDTYRTQKALEVYLSSGEIPSRYFNMHPPRPVITHPLPIYEIAWERDILRERIALRTETMLSSGLIDEIIMLEKRYTRAPNCMKAIGIKETLAYLDGKYDKKTLKEKIATNTARLAKRQGTFNRSQFNNVRKGSAEEIEKWISSR
jgi:tRNA dimethylallyltransferase